MAAKRLADRIRQEIDDLQATLRVLERFGETTNGHHSMDVAGEALEHAKRMKSGRVLKHPSRAKGTLAYEIVRHNRLGANGKLPEVAAPAGLSLKKEGIVDAIRLTLKAVKRPIHTPELTALLLAAGFPKAKNVALTSFHRSVGQAAGVLLKRHEAERSLEGWALK